MTEKIMELVRYAAKAVAGFLIPWVLFTAAWAGDKLGIDIPVDAGAIEAAITSVFVAAAVYVKRNVPKWEPPRPLGPAE